MEEVLTLLVILFSLVTVTIALYIYLNDRKIGQLPPETAQLFSPAPGSLEPQNVLSVAESLSKNPVVMKNFLPPQTGRRYIVVGGSGFLGGWIVIQLLERGEDPRKIRILDVDISDAAAVSEAFKAPWSDTEDDQEVTVFHTAANIRFYERDVRLLPRSSKVNYNGTLNVIEACREIGANTLIYTSTGCISVRHSRLWLWPWERRSEFFVQVCDDENNRLLSKQHNHFCSNYAVSKFSAEMAVRAADKSLTCGSRALRTGCIRPGNGIFGPGGDLICEAYLARKDNLVWAPNCLQPLVFVENCALAHLCYEQRLIELEKGTTNPDIGGQAFTIAGGPPITNGDVCTAVSTLDKETVFRAVSPSFLLGISHVVEALYVSKLLLSTSDSAIERAVARMIPTVSGDLINLQPSTIVLSTVNLVFDDTRARLVPAQGGLGYHEPYTTLQGICKTVDEYHKSKKNRREQCESDGFKECG